MNNFEQISLELGNSQGELKAVKQHGKYYLVLGDYSGDNYIPISKEFFEAIRQEFETALVVK